MKILLNGTETEIEENILTITDLLMSLNIPTIGTAVALNYKVIKKSEHQTTHISENDAVEIVRAVAGG